MTRTDAPKTGQAPFARVPLLARGEGGAIAVVAAAVFISFGFSWWWPLVLFPLLDLSFLGYAGGIRIGGIVYNAAHNYIVPSILAATHAVLVLVGTGAEPLVFIAGVWFFHVGLDRALGYGPRPLTWQSSIRHDAELDERKA